MAQAPGGNIKSQLNQEETLQELTSLAQNLDKISRHLIAGKPVYDVLKNPANDIHWLFTATGGLGTLVGGRYEFRERVMQLTKGGDEKLFVHEGFHAMQFANGVSFYSLDTRDDAIVDFLTEASAVAHTFIYFKENEKNDPVAYQEFVSSGCGMGMVSLFEQAYSRVMATPAIGNKALREKKALEAGGQEVVRNLMAGHSSFWTGFYSPKVQDLVREHAPTVVGPRPAGYEERRRHVFAMTGYISHDICVTPPEFLQKDNDVFLGATLNKINFHLPPQRPVPKADTLKTVLKPKSPDVTSAPSAPR